MIIGLTGLKGAGKDTVGAYLVKEHNFERRGFADPLKRSFSALFDIPLHEIEKFKNDDTVFVTVGYKNEPTVVDYHPAGFSTQVPPTHMWSPITEMSFRESLQRYGTESHRDVFGENFWVDQTLPVDAFYTGRAIVVTDVRFTNEAERIYELGGHIVRIKRRNFNVTDQYDRVADIHSSETEQLLIKTDYTLENNGTIRELFEATERMLGVFLG